MRDTRRASEGGRVEPKEHLLGRVDCLFRRRTSRGCRGNVQMVRDQGLKNISFFFLKVENKEI